MIAQQLQRPLVAAPVRVLDGLRAVFAHVGWALEVNRRIEEEAVHGRVDGDTLRKILAEVGEPR